MLLHRCVRAWAKLHPNLRGFLLLLLAIVLMVATLAGGGPRSETRPVPQTFRWILVGCAFAPLVFALAQVFGVRRVQALAVGTSLVALVCYWSRTPWYTRGHDVDGNEGHLAYVMHIVEHGTIPDPNAGWTFYHPPLYYLLCALIARAMRPFGIDAPTALQAFSLCLWLVFLLASAGAIRLAIRDSKQQVIATLALSFWPSGVMHAVRIGNDMPLYATTAVATWFMVRYWRSLARLDLLGLSTFTGLAIMSKSNALVPVLTFGGLLLTCSVFRARSNPLRKNATVLRERILTPIGFAGAGALAVMLNVGFRAHYYMTTPRDRWLVGNIHLLTPKLRVPVDVVHMLVPDVRVYLTHPWLNTFEDATGRAYFWNALWRSSLSGEFQFSGSFRKGIALLWGALLLLLLTALVAGALRALWTRRWRRRLALDLPWMVLTVTWLASVFALRIQAPFACSNDFRYVLPILVPAVITWTRLGRVSRVLLCTMVLSSAAFFVTLGLPAFN
jgi:hypothetical protein